MRKTLAFLATGLLFLASCSKKENPLPGETWNCTSYKVNTYEIFGSIVTSLTVSFAEDGTFTYVINGAAGTGTYTLNEDQTLFSFTAPDMSGNDMTVSILNDSTFHFAGNGTASGNPGHLEFHFVR